MKTVNLIGLEWDKSNIYGLHTFENAIEKASERGKRLPTKAEFMTLKKLPSGWDYERNGRWFAKEFKDLGDPEKSLFLPAMGWWSNIDEKVVKENDFGVYWSQTPRLKGEEEIITDEDGEVEEVITTFEEIGGAWGLGFHSRHITMANADDKDYRFSVRCVKNY
jgi:hypothetical protein